MKYFEEPKISIKTFEVEDVIATSGDDGNGGGDGNVGGEIYD